MNIRPEILTAAPIDAHRDLMLLPDGAIRHYGAQEREPDGFFRMICLESRDSGDSWTRIPVPAGSPGATVRSPWSGDFLTLLEQDGRSNDGKAYPALRNAVSTGVWAFRSSVGPDGPFTAEKVFSTPWCIQRQPLALRTRKRWIVACSLRLPNHHVLPGVLISDDDAHSFRLVEIEAPPVHMVTPPHLGVRWLECGCEPVVAERPDGVLAMLLRTSTDFHYQAFSHDGGDTWTKPEIAPFYACATMPNLMTLADGRMLAVWNNTTPLPELDHSTQPILNEAEKTGVWEDVFTNRDAIHAVVSEDGGKTWHGYRELALNPIRHSTDFRCTPPRSLFLDKSIHQNQGVEIASGVIVLAFGQHPACRRILRFSVDFLYEKNRTEDFMDGLAAWSVQQYYRGVYGGFRGCTGHCSYNRRAGAVLMPDPENPAHEALFLGRHHDPRLISSVEGAVWNFPAGKRGRLAFRLTVMPASPGVRIALTDRWLNPTDPTVRGSAFAFLELTGSGEINGKRIFAPGVSFDLTVWFDCGTGTVSCSADGGESVSFRANGGLKQPVAAGLSYLHLQSLAEADDAAGVYLSRVSATVE